MCCITLNSYQNVARIPIIDYFCRIIIKQPIQKQCHDTSLRSFSEFIAFSNIGDVTKSGELKAQGIDVINLSVGEPDFNTPDFIKEAAKKAIDDNFSRYSPVAGYPALRNAIVAKLKNENGLEYTAGQISCANGAKQSVCNTVMVLVNPGTRLSSLPLSG